VPDKEKRKEKLKQARPSLPILQVTHHCHHCYHCDIMAIHTAISIIKRAPATPTPCCSLSSLRDRKKSTGSTIINITRLTLYNFVIYLLINFILALERNSIYVLRALRKIYGFF